MRAREHLPALGRRTAYALAGLAALAGAAYAWWATGTRSFSGAADIAVGIPVALVALAALPNRDRQAGRRLSLRLAAPWILLALGAVALESIALGLGGRSRAVPSLSTVIDQALAWHVGRFALFALWLAAAAWSLRRGIRRQDSTR
ncbi:MAG: hypothetical protein ACLPQS_17150 [Acidimicrobiales bacterium]|jgi:hypothetical protein